MSVVSVYSIEICAAYVPSVNSAQVLSNATKVKSYWRPNFVDALLKGLMRQKLKTQPTRSQTSTKSLPPLKLDDRTKNKNNFRTKKQVLLEQQSEL